MSLVEAAVEAPISINVDKGILTTNITMAPTPGPSPQPSAVPSPKLQEVTHSVDPSPLPDLPHDSHTATTCRAWTAVQQLCQTSVSLTGNTLDIAGVVAVIRHGVSASVAVTPALEARIAASIEVLDQHLARGWTVYGVNTGYGGSADVRTDTYSKDAMRHLQLALLQHQQSGIIPVAERTGAAPDGSAPHVMPTAWVRAAMLVRANQNVRGHSAIRLGVIQRLLDMLADDATPVVPLRGSISASGDLQPLSYIAGALTGNPDIWVNLGPKHNDAIISSAAYWAKRHPNTPSPALLTLEPKEALGLINGTAPSAAVAALILHDASALVVLTQMLTAMTAEGLGANVEWAHDFVHACRPHPGQREAATNIRRFLAGSSLVLGLDGASRRRTGDGLWQDRYSTRTAAQWLGPYLEDLVLAHRQVVTELNSTSDNPLIQTPTATSAGDVFSGGNFQATSITSAMDKTRLALTMAGRLLFSQVSELINPSTNNGLPANLSIADPDDFALKGVDINVAAYTAELSALAHPVSAHVLPAEMGNQGVNSLALITARRTAEAVDLLMHICAVAVYAACQAMQIRSLYSAFLDAALGPKDGPAFLAPFTDTPESLWPEVASAARQAFHASNTLSWPQRASAAASSAITTLLPLVPAATLCHLPALRTALYTHFLTHLALAGISPLRPTEGQRYGHGTRQMLRHVRSELGVPMHKGRVDDPVLGGQGETKTVGSRVTAVYEAIRGGGLLGVVMQVLEE